MHFLRLKLTGFKSFVEPTEFRIETGLTGIVGPNGCGKSNLLEAMRWVMGATSAKALRGEGMEDVIFSGSDKRASRNWAEVALSIDNAERRAPQPFTDMPVLEVTRRIDRGGGSTYRINGKEVRARDVQLLFADASTGANSPALVRQGQISELIAAKPQNRRRILEEAGGVSGLHTRRHEAELRLKAAETNLTRLDDIFRELDSVMSRLKREARQAEKYRKISGDIRNLQRAIALVRWQEAKAAHDHQTTEIQGVDIEIAALTVEASRTQRQALEQAETLGPVRDEVAIATAVAQKLMIDKERLDLEEKQSLGEIDRLRAEIKRIAIDFDREDALSRDGEAQITRLEAACTRIRAEIESAPQQEPELLNALKGFEQARREAELRIETATSKLAAKRERERAHESRLSEANAHLNRLRTQYKQAESDKSALAEFDHTALISLEAKRSESEDLIEKARRNLNQSEARRNEALTNESQMRLAFRDAEDRLGQVQTQIRGLNQLLITPRKALTPALDQVRPQPGYEAALAAALGDDLNFGVSSKAPGGTAEPGPDAFWDQDAEPFSESHAWKAFGSPQILADYVEVPSVLKHRLMMVVVVSDSQAGDALQKQLPVGGRLVSKAGDMWRWDGLVVRARAPKPATLRLEQRQKLALLESERDRLTPELEAARLSHGEAQLALKAIESELSQLRQALPEAEKRLRAFQAKRDALHSAQARFDAQSNALAETLSRLAGELTEAAARLSALENEAIDETDLSDIESMLDETRKAAEVELQNILTTRARIDEDHRVRTQREAALKSNSRELEDWRQRLSAGTAQRQRLSLARETAQAQLDTALSAPDVFKARREQLVDELAVSERRLSAAREALNTAEQILKDSDIAERSTAQKLAQAREIRAGAAARLESLAERLSEIEAHIVDSNGFGPDALAQKLREEAIATPPDLAGAETLLSGLERERDELGPVNLRAEDEVSEHQGRLETISRERLDLTTAIAKLRDGIDELNLEGRERLLKAFDTINAHFKTLFVTLFGGGTAELRLIESDDPLEAGLEIFACPPGKRLTSMSLMSGGEQALTATALIFGVFLANPAPVCVLDEVDAPLDDANVDRYCRLLDEMRRLTKTRFIAITHNPVTMARMDRLFGVTMFERGVSQLVSVDLNQAEALVA